MVFAVNEEPDTLDEQKSSFAITDDIVSNIGASLVSKDTDGNYIPYMAESWETSADALVWTFHLKTTPKFHNGDPVTANDWVYSINRVKDPNFTSPVSASLFAPITSAIALDDYTLQLTLDAPFYPILENLASPGYAGVWSQRAIEEAGDQYGWSTAIGAGPYIFKEWVQDEKLVLERNPDFTWGPEFYAGANTGPYYIETLEWRFVPDLATVLAGLEGDELSFASIDPKDIATIEDTGLYDIITGQRAHIWYLEFNLSKPPFDNVHVRRAFNYMLNRDEIIQVVRLGHGVKVLGPLSPAMIGYWPGQEEIGLDYNPDKVKEEFLAAGYTYSDYGTVLDPQGNQFVVDIWVESGDEEWMKTCQVIQGQFAALGVTLNIQQMEWTALSAKLTEGDYNLDLMGVGWSEADILYIMFHSSSNWWSQMAKVPDAQLDALLEATRTETDAVARQDAVNAAVTYLVENAFIVPIQSGSFFRAVDKDLSGWIYSPFTGFVFSDAYFTNLP
jgi:peptide/nickel transport system substrate-binding protein